MVLLPLLVTGSLSRLPSIAAPGVLNIATQLPLNTTFPSSVFWANSALTDLSWATGTLVKSGLLGPRHSCRDLPRPCAWVVLWAPLCVLRCPHWWHHLCLCWLSEAWFGLSPWWSHSRTFFVPDSHPVALENSPARQPAHCYCPVHS